MSLVTRSLGLLIALALATAFPALAQEPEEHVPPKLALLVMLKVLTYDKNLEARGGGDFVVLVATEPGQEEALKEAQTATRSLSGAKLNARAVRFEFSRFDSGDDLLGQVQRHHAHALLVLPGLSEAGLAAATFVSDKLKLYSLSLDPRLVERSMAVGVTNNDGRPQIVINLAAARRVNAAFEPAVLRLAKLIQ